MKSDLQLLPIDSVPVSTPTWADIAGKAHLYKTARLRSTGEYVSIVGVSRPADELLEARFKVRVPGFDGVKYLATEELCAFCL